MLYNLIIYFFYQSESEILRPRILRPYIIGLTGGIASGKSSVAEKLKQLGAGLVNCDKLAHNLYLPGTDCFHKIIEYFGSSILDSNGFINRKLLGDIVFNNKVLGVSYSIIFIMYVIS